MINYWVDVKEVRSSTLVKQLTQTPMKIISLTKTCIFKGWKKITPCRFRKVFCETEYCLLRVNIPNLVATIENLKDCKRFSFTRVS